MTAEPPSKLLTAIMPTRNRPDNVARQLRLFESSPYPMIVADSSDAENAGRIRAVVLDRMEFRALARELTLYDKLDLVLREVDTPFVALVSDRKITFPHAIDALLAHLLADDDPIAAVGYILGFTPHPDAIDINRVIWFTPTIGDDDPLQRHYHLMQRYQSRAFSVFRIAPLRRAVAQARRVEGALFQEILMMNALVLQGRFARLPAILTLQGEERSFHPPTRNDPLFWFIDDIGSFFRHYARYRTALADFIRELGIAPPTGTDLDQLVDMVHAVWLHRNFDDGVLNHATRLLLGDAIEPLSGPQTHHPWREPAGGDVTEQGRLRYVWRDRVLRAEPADEIYISRDEMDRVRMALDAYFAP
jgi:glycosyltransferase domain-containing protein